MKDFNDFIKSAGDNIRLLEVYAYLIKERKKEITLKAKLREYENDGNIEFNGAKIMRDGKNAALDIEVDGENITIQYKDLHAISKFIRKWENK